MSQRGLWGAEDTYHRHLKAITGNNDFETKS